MVTTVTGITFLENRIFVVCSGLGHVFVFSGQKPFGRMKYEEIDIKEMKNPSDMTSSSTNRAIFVSDSRWDGGCVWKIQMSNAQVKKFLIEGQPTRLSMSPKEELLVLVQKSRKRGDQEGKFWYVDLYNSSEFKIVMSLQLPIDMKQPVQAVQTSKNTFIVLFGTEDRSKKHTGPTVFGWIVSEITTEGSTVHSFNISVGESKVCDEFNWHMTINDDDQIFVADKTGNKVILLDSMLIEDHILLKSSDKYKINLPTRLHYLRDKQQLIVGYFTQPGSFSIFSLSAGW